MRKKKFLTGILLVMGCFMLMTGCAGTKETEKRPAPSITVKDSGKDPEEKEPEEVRKQEEDAEERKQEPESGMELKGVTEGLFSVLEIEEETVKKELMKWTSKNGYAGASGAVFYDPMWIYFAEDKYSLDCYLIFEHEGNGIRPDDEQKKITMDYYKSKRRIEFHE